VTPQIQPVEGDRVIDGVLRAIGVLVILAILVCVINFVGIFGFGLAQWVGLLPLYFYEKSKGRRLAGKGVLLTGLVVFLLQAACYGVVLVGLRGGVH
jgi:hypothetical protein